MVEGTVLVGVGVGVTVWLAYRWAVRRGEQRGYDLGWDEGAAAAWRFVERDLASGVLRVVQPGTPEALKVPLEVLLARDSHN